jgi:CheY-like chemotaxis protein
VTVPIKILVVDDDPALCEFMQEVLISENIQAHVIADSVQAAARLKEERFDAVFLDMRMPSPDGIELARQIRSSGLNGTTPLVMITGENDHTLMGRAFQAGVNLFLFKPVDRIRLIRLLHAADNFIRAEKRRFTRVHVRRKVSIESGENRLTGTTLDLSLTGMLARASSVMPVGSAVHVNLELMPGMPALRVAARVVRLSGDNCMGLRYEDTGPVLNQGLEKFLLPLILAETDQKSSRGSP